MSKAAVLKLKARQNTKTDGVVVYRGPSMLDRQPIVAIAIGLRKGSDNPKTGDMVQVYILREDIEPTQALHTGDDASICGDCPLRGTIVNGRNKGRPCYVNVFMAPQGVWKAYRKGNYPVATDLAATFAGHAVRLGAYGDPAAVPLHIWQAVLSNADGWTGYTHQWRDFPEFAGIVMASADTLDDAKHAQMLGFRTFRVTAGDSIAERQHNEFVCPASDEMGKKLDCATCLACGGNGSRNRAFVVVTVHGTDAKANAFGAMLATLQAAKKNAA